MVIMVYFGIMLNLLMILLQDHHHRDNGLLFL